MAKTCSTCKWWGADESGRFVCRGWGPVSEYRNSEASESRRKNLYTRWPEMPANERCPRHEPAAPQLYRIDWDNGEIDGNLTEEMLISMLVDGEGATSDTPFRVFRQDS